MMNANDSWRGYRLAKRSLAASLLLAVFEMTSSFGRQYLGMPVTMWDKMVAILVLPTMITFFCSVLICQWWACPRCKKMFHIKWYGVRPFAQSCQHCGLEKWTAPDRDVPQVTTDSKLREVDKFWETHADLSWSD